MMKILLQRTQQYLKMILFGYINSLIDLKLKKCASFLILMRNNTRLLYNILFRKNCYVALLSIVFRGDFSYTSSKNIMFNNARFKCQKKTGQLCNLRFTLNGGNVSFELNTNSFLQGEQIVLQGQNLTVKLDSTSFINATGSSDELYGT